MKNVLSIQNYMLVTPVANCILQLLTFSLQVTGKWVW